MSDTIVAFTVRTDHPGVPVIGVRGDVTPTAEDDLMAAWTAASEKATSGVIIDFTDLDYMNSGGIGLLVTLLVRAQRQKQQLVAFGLSDHYRQIFSLTRLDDAISICDDEQAAIAAAT